MRRVPRTISTTGVLQNGAEVDSTDVMHNLGLEILDIIQMGYLRNEPESNNWFFNIVAMI